MTLDFLEGLFPLPDDPLGDGPRKVGKRWQPPPPRPQGGFRHDPLDPHPEEPTPIDLVHRLTRPEREQRVLRLIEMAYGKYAEAIEFFITDEHKVHHSTCLLFSGGKDSSTLAALFRPVATHVVHADTRTGIEATRDFVRSTAAGWDLPLIMESGNDDYFDFVLGRVRTVGGVSPWPGGFPGPAAHFLYYQRLKERAFVKAKHRLGISGSRDERSVWIAGRRRSESTARANVPWFEREGPIVWFSPLAIWHKADLLTLRLMRPHDVPVNPVADKLGMSAECGCLCNAHPGEREAWFAHYPDEPFLRRVLEVEEILQGPEFDHVPGYMKRWGWGAHKADLERDHRDAGRLCGRDCGPDPLLDMMDPLWPENPPAFHLDPITALSGTWWAQP